MKNFFFLALCIGYAVLSLLSCGDNSPACPFCDEQLQANNISVSTSAEILPVEMAWIAVEGSPTVENPSLVCEDDFRDVLFRRHIRANACIWTEQCRVVLTPLFHANPEYKIIPDPNSSVGFEGDVIDVFQERREVLINAFMGIDRQFKGIVAVQIRKFILANGENSTTLGRAGTNMRRPYLIVTDPEFIYEDHPDHSDHINTEQVLAHEIGHALNLCHTSQSCLNLTAPWTNNLMIETSNVDNRILVESQCNRAREYILDSLGVFSSNTALVDVFYDDTQNDLIPSRMKHIEFDGLGILSNKKHPNNFKVLLTTKGIVRENAHFSIGINIDNEITTGGSMDLFESKGQLKGVDFLVDLTVEKGEISNYKVLVFEKNKFIDNIELEPYVSPKFNTIDEYIYSTKGCETIPSFNEIEIDINLNLLELSMFERQRAAMDRTKITIEATSAAADKKGTLFQDNFPVLSRPVRIN